MSNLKNYTYRVPQTDQEVEDCIRQTHGDTLTTKIMIGIYQIRRAKGEDILTAWEVTLRAYLEAVGTIEKT